jgi:hypothetical protein
MVQSGRVYAKESVVNNNRGWFGFLSALALCTPLAAAQSTELANPQPTFPEGPAERTSELAERRSGLDSFIGEQVVDSPAPTAAERGQSAGAAASTAALPYYLQLGNGSTPLPPRSTHVCTFSSLAGGLATNTIARVRYFESTQELGILDGTASNWAVATCAPKSKFFNNSFTPISQVGVTKYSFVESGKTSYYEDWGNAAAMLTGVGGPFRSLGDEVRVVQLAASARNEVRIYAEGSGNIIGYSTSFWFNENTSAQKSIKFIGPNGTGSVGSAGEYYLLKRELGTKTISLASSATSFCFLSRVRGELSQAGDVIQVYENAATGKWALNVQKQNAGELHAFVRCMAYDQR